MNVETEVTQPITQLLQQARQHLEQGNLEAAERCYRNILSENDQQTEALYNMALLSLRLSQPGHALIYAEQLEKLLPENKDVLVMSASAAYSCKQYHKTIATLHQYCELEKQAHSQVPGNILYQLALAYFNIGRPELCIKNLKAIPESAYNATIYNTLASCYHILGFQEEAETCCRQALHEDSDNVGLQLNFANFLGFNGRAEEAQQHYEKCLDLDGSCTVAFMQMAKQQSNKESRKELLKRIQNHKTTATPETEKYLHFAQASLYEKLGDYEHAFSHYTKANNFTTNIPYIEKQGLKNQQRLEVCQKIFPKLIAQQKANQHYKTTSDIQPIFIVGMPRSGTSLAEQILSAHSSVYGCGELARVDQIITQSNPDHPKSSREFIASLEGLTQDQLQQMRQAYRNAVLPYNRSGCTIITDKQPYNFMNVGLIHLLFPQSPIIHCKRQPMDIAWSNFSQHFASGSEWSYSLEHIPAMLGLYEAYMQLWQKLLPDRIYNLHYETLVTHKETSITDLLEHCKLKPEPQCLTPETNKTAVLTASAEQIRKPIYQSSIGRWQRFASNLEEPFQALIASQERHQQELEENPL